MPLFEYQCITCGTVFEHFVRSTIKQEEIICPTCAGSEVNQKFSTFGMKGAAGGGAVSSGDTCSTGGG